MRRELWMRKEMLLASLLAVVVVAASATLAVVSVASSQQKVETRFIDRVEGGASFVSAYMNQKLERQAQIAQQYLRGEVGPRRMRLLTETLDATASVLLDGHGSLISGYPYDGAMVGTNLSAKYPHLASALAGHPTVSPVVLSAVEKVPVVGAAVPYETPTGRRVFSTAMSISTTPLARYLETMVPIQGASTRLFDVAGTPVVLGQAGMPSSDPQVVKDLLEPGTSLRRIKGIDYFYSSQAIVGTPWTIISEIPRVTLLAPLKGVRAGAFVMVGLVLLMAIGTLLLFAGYTKERHDFRHRALHCPLTGLANRDLLEENATRELAKLDRRPGSVGLLYLDLDDFKAINDDLGHKAGDQLLVEVAARLRKSLRPYDIPARLGGDEFAILLPDLQASGLAVVAERIRLALAAPYSLCGSTRGVGASIGGVQVEEVSGLSDLIARADAAMYSAKRLGKGRIVLAETPAPPGPKLALVPLGA